MEELEHASRLLALDEEAQEALRRAREESGVNQEEFQKAINDLSAFCIHSVEQITNAFITLRNTLTETITPALQALSDNFRSIFPTEDLFFMVPPHVRHLAYNHPKARVRNKNWNRMWKIRERYMKWHKD